MSSFNTKLIDAVQETLSLPESSIKQLQSDISKDGFNRDILTTLKTLSTTLQSLNLPKESTIIDLVYDKATDSPSHGGLGITSSTPASSTSYDEVLFLISAHLTALHTPLARDYLSTIPHPLPQTQPMTLSQKIFAQHVLGTVPQSGLSVGSVCRVGLDWILASELSWSEMARTYQKLGAPGIWRNDRFWLAGDHLVHPAVKDNPKIASMVAVAEKAKRDFKMTDYQGMNYTIMHTEFVRERAEPGMLCVGSDSHTCSGGAMGCLSIGLGAADVMLALALGETWFKVPESVKIEFKGKPRWGVSGKDVILHILGKLKRNTYASERIVEFMGEGCRYLSVDARFAICNMCTEFGAITGVFVPDELTRDYVQKRRRKLNKQHSVYFKPDDDAVYASEHVIDLGEVESTVAVYPEPDNVVPVSEKAGMPVDGVFIGACTTTEEELVLAALVLKAGLKKGLPMAKGKRHYVPGSLPIVDKLDKLGLLKVYEDAGFTRGPPGCSYCVGLSAEKAEKGETWLSSQNRNFKNRMGTGSFGNLSSAVVCAATAFSMTITDPAPFIAEMDSEWFEKEYKGTVSASQTSTMTYTEPDLEGPQHESKTSSSPATKPDTSSDTTSSSTSIIKSHIITLPSFIDTDALAPGPTLATCVTDEDFGQHVLEYTHPEFRSTIKSSPYDGSAIVVAGEGFGVGSSRECAVSALKGAGVKCVISKSFAFIFARNLPSLGLWGFNLPMNSDFWDVVYRDEMNKKRIEVDVAGRKVKVEMEEGGEWREWGFELSEMEYQLTMNKGVTESFKRLGRGIWAGMMKKDGEEVKVEGGKGGGNNSGEVELGGEASEVQKKMDW